MLTEKDIDRLEKDILKNIAQLQTYLARTSIDSLEPAYQLISRQMNIMYDMLVLIHIIEPIILEVPSMSHEGTGTPTEDNAFTGDNPLYRDSVGGEESLCSSKS